MNRWVRKSRRVYDWARCELCGTGWGANSNHQCPPTTCPICGTRTCMGYGLGNGQCPVCFFGLLPGWSGSTGQTCGYAHCDKPAIARNPRNQHKVICADHWTKLGGADYVANAMERRAKDWALVAEL